MKKYILFLFLLGSLDIAAQEPVLRPIIDTVIVRNLSMQARDWLLLVKAVHGTDDSLSIKTLDRIQAVAKAASPALNAALIVDSLPGSVVMAFYRRINTLPAGVVSARFSAIRTAIRARVNLDYFTNEVDLFFSRAYDKEVQVGKHIIID